MIFSFPLHKKNSFILSIAFLSTYWRELDSSANLRRLVSYIFKESLSLWKWIKKSLMRNSTGNKAISEIKSHDDGKSYLVLFSQRCKKQHFLLTLRRLLCISRARIDNVRRKTRARSKKVASGFTHIAFFTSHKERNFLINLKIPPKAINSMFRRSRASSNGWSFPAAKNAYFHKKRAFVYITFNWQPRTFSHQRSRA